MVRKKLLVLAGFVIVAAVALGRRSREDPVQVEIADAGAQQRSARDATTAGADAGAAGETSSGVSADEAADDQDATGEDAAELESIEGVGPAYADRLREAGVEDVADLASADAEALAEETGVEPGRVRDWIGQARDRADG